MKKRNVRRRFSEVVGSMLLVAFSLVLAMGAAEGLLRFQDGRYAQFEAAQRAMYEFDSELGWRKRANAERLVVTSEFRVHERTNSFGLRGAEVSLQKPSGVKRILLLGDSFTEGYTVARSDTVSERLQAALRMNLDSEVEVINAGTGGYSTDQELLYYLREGRQFEPDVVVLLAYDNDIIYNVRARYWRGEKPLLVAPERQLDDLVVPINIPVAHPDRRAQLQPVDDEPDSGPIPWLRWSRVYQEAILKGDWARWLRVATGGVIRDVHAGWSDVPDEYRAYETEPGTLARQAWNTTEMLIRLLDEQVRRDGAQLIVFYVPHKGAVYGDTWREMRTKYGMLGPRWSITNIRDQLGRICAEHDIPFIDPVERYRQEARRAELQNDRLYFVRDGHWTPRGHHLAAEVLSDQLGAVMGEKPAGQMVAALQ